MKNLPVEARLRQGVSPLAKRYGQPELLSFLIEKGADINFTNDFGDTALMRAAGDTAKIKLLVNKGADVNARSRGSNDADQKYVAVAPADTKKVLRRLAGRVLGRRGKSTTTRPGMRGVCRAAFRAGDDCGQRYRPKQKGRAPEDLAQSKADA